jgi:hypothetical protein
MPGKNLSKQLESLYIWEYGWSLPNAFESKKMLRIYLSKNDYWVIISKHLHLTQSRNAGSQDEEKIGGRICK